ncbi:hypothetical protein VOLCADRAFT_93756 [Volvox carteri f. nagariensis]|uniref:Uncharacterized protein n=1 Tax=Volvox carteri f. nagariensis TaxID=3068 RepID=D8U2Z3_VOLCA|nr:uncharacterized protein VOLCADRAFT_93756 [Volvox carteri f. nagariensis]EFJ45890.1 hypothetical protein VOLCADRAFT_93756 [Volvox carteri f. nagariensis]|eukprot:XP_002952968.1 hypothetical protein VOLCADRAFT_93756 [Volvox carteri f. nagariensis]
MGSSMCPVRLGVEPFVPVLFVVPILFITTMVLHEGLGVHIMSPTASRTLLKFGIAVGSRSMILLKSLLLGKGSQYYKRESNMVRSTGCREVVQLGDAVRWCGHMGQC